MLDPAYLLFCMVLAIFLMIGCIVRGYREKEKTIYLVAMIPFFWFLAMVCAFLNQRTLEIIFFACSAVVGIASLPGLLKHNKRKVKEEFAHVDLSAPVRLRDLFTSKGLFKLANKWGVKKTVYVLWLSMTPILGGGLLVLGLWLKFLSIGYIISYTFTVSTAQALAIKYHLNKALREKPSEVARVPTAYISLNAEGLYRKLLDMYIRAWGSRLGATRELENNIQSCVEQGFNREEAIRKIAAWEFEGIPWET